MRTWSASEIKNSVQSFLYLYEHQYNTISRLNTKMILEMYKY